jgi:hypothetical protein
MEEAKAAKLHASFLAAQEFNAAQTAANNEAKVRLFQEDRRNAEVLKIKFKEQMAEEAAKEEARRAKVKKLQQFHVKQIDEKKCRIAALHEESNDEIREMERQFAIQVGAPRASAAASPSPACPLFFSSRRAGCRVSGLCRQAC